MSCKSAKKQRNEAPVKRPGISLHICGTCSRDLSDEMYIKCGRCANFFQCLECFSIGAEAAPHIRSHSFVLIDPVAQPIFQKGWSGEDEAVFLSALQVSGLGNWHDISDALKTKSPQECEQHYFSTFFEANSAPMPEDKVIPEPFIPPSPQYDTTPRESRPSIAHKKNLHERGKKEGTTPGEFAGWMPRRMEFEVECWNEAESFMKGVKFNEEDETAATLAQKLASLRTYNEKLEERHARTKLAVQWDLPEREFKSFGGITKGEQEMEEALMPLAQIVEREELTCLIHSVQDEMRLKEQIEMYKKWRRNGIVRRDEGIRFNQLEGLMSDDRLSTAAVEKWNRDVTIYAESPEFRATLDRHLLSTAENELCQLFGLAPHSYLRVKDLLLREFQVRGVMTRELAMSFMPRQEEVMASVFDSMDAVGLFYNMQDVDAQTIEEAPSGQDSNVTEGEEEG